MEEKCLEMPTLSYTGCLVADSVRALILSLRFNGHFPGEPGLAGVY